LPEPEVIDVEEPELFRYYIPRNPPPAVHMFRCIIEMHGTVIVDVTDLSKNAVKYKGCRDVVSSGIRLKIEQLCTCSSESDADVFIVDDDDNDERRKDEVNGVIDPAPPTITRGPN